MVLITISLLKQAINKLAKFDSLNKMVKKPNIYLKQNYQIEFAYYICTYSI
jgi:hypothetical protein